MRVCSDVKSFSIQPQAEYQQTYLDLAAALKPELQKIDGFISVERFQSLTDPGKVLSLSFWRDEQACCNGVNLSDAWLIIRENCGARLRSNRVMQL